MRKNIVFQCSCFNVVFVSRERKHRVTMLVFNHQKRLSEPKLHFPLSYVVHSYVPLPLGEFQYPPTSAALGLNEQLQTCSSTVIKNYQRDSSVGLDFGRSVRRYCVFSEENIRTMLDHSTPLFHPSSEFYISSRHQVQHDRFIQINLQ